MQRGVSRQSVDLLSKVDVKATTDDRKRFGADSVRYVNKARDLAWLPMPINGGDLPRRPGVYNDIGGAGKLPFGSARFLWQ